MTPLTFHRKAGWEPPLTGVAVKVTMSPTQAGFAEAEMLTLTGRLGLTTILIGCELAGFPVAQGRLEVIAQVTTSPFAGGNVNTGPVPALTPLTLHC